MGIATRTVRRAGFGCGLAAGTLVSAMLLLAGCLFVTGRIHPRGIDPGIVESVIFSPILLVPAVAVVGAIGAWRARAGLVLAGIVLACTLALGIRVLILLR